MEDLQKMDLKTLKTMTVRELTEIAIKLGIEDYATMLKQELIFKILEGNNQEDETLEGDGLLEIIALDKDNKYGFLRSPNTNYQQGKNDIYVSPAQIKKLGLKTGHYITGQIRAPKEGEKYFALTKVDTVNETDPELIKKIIMFENLTPLHPNDRFKLENRKFGIENETLRILDLFAPLGKRTESSDRVSAEGG
jgi:transcription termination factor Rho